MAEPQRDASTQPVPWGIALRVAAQRQPGGTLKLVEAIQKEVGHGIGSRPTFLNLYRHMADPSLLQTDIERQRAWFLLVAMGEQPADWGVDDSCLPDAWYRNRHEIAGRIRFRVMEHAQTQYEEAANGDHHATAGRHH